MYVTMLESQTTSIMGVKEDFCWGQDLVNTQFSSNSHPIFQIDLLMNDKGAYFSTDPSLFEVCSLNFSVLQYVIEVGLMF